MKQRSRRLAIVLTIVGLIAFVVAAISLAVRPDWRDLPFWWLLLGLGALTGVLGFFNALGATQRFFSDLFGWSESDAIEMPLQAVAVEELFQPFGRSANIAWVNRQQTSIDLLNRHPRLLITGRMKIGKSREAAELIRQAVAGDMLSATRIFQPTPLLKVANAESVRQSLARHLDPLAPALVFLDDLPFHYGESSLENLEALLHGLAQCKAAYVVATARLDQLGADPKMTTWLKAHHFQAVALPDLDEGQTGRLLDSAAIEYGMTMEAGARQAFVVGGDGTPELTLLHFRRLELTQEIGQIGADKAETLARESLQTAWDAARNDLQRYRPDTRYLFPALDAFHAAGVTAYEPLALHYAAYLERAATGRRLPWYGLRRWQAALAYLGHFNVIAGRGVIQAPDPAVENRLSQRAAEEALGAFLQQHHRLWRRPLLRRFYRAAEAYMWACFDLAMNASSRKELPKALAWYSAGLSAFAHFGLYNNRGLTYSDLGQHEAALADYSRAIAFNPEDATAYYNRANKYSDLRQREAALADYSRAIALDPEYAAAYSNRANVYAELNRLPEAIATFQKAIDLDPNLAAPHNGLGNVYADLGRTAEAIASFQKAIDLNSNLAAPHNGLGNVYRTLGRTAEAIAAYQKAIDLDPNAALPHNGLGNVYRTLGRIAEAIAAYQKAIDLNPNYAYPHYGLGIVYGDLSRLSEASAAFQKAIDLDSNAALPQYGLGNRHYTD